MGKKRRVLLYVSAGCMLLLMLGTILSYFIAPYIVDAKTRRELGLPEDAIVTDTARSPWIYVNERGEATVYGEKLVGVQTLYVPSAVNGIAVKRLVKHSTSKSVETVILPPTLVPPNTVNCFRNWEGLKTIVFAEGTQSIADTVVHTMPSLQAVYLPKSLTVVSSRLAGQEGVTLYYAGTEEEWLSLGNSAKSLSDKGIVVFDTPFVDEARK